MKGWRFRPGEALDEAFRRTALEEIAAARAGLAATETDRQRTIHEARRSFKRLRALLRLASPGMERALAKENRRLRDAGRLLAPARDAAVLLLSYDRFVEQSGADFDPDHLAVLRGRLEPKRASNGADPESLQAHLSRAVGLTERAERNFGRLRWPADADALRKGLRRSQERLKGSFRAARDSGDGEDLHDWRKRLKDFSGQIELLRDIGPEPLKELRKQAKQIAALLGEEHDLCLLAAKLEAARLPARIRPTRDALVERIFARREKLRKRALRLGEAHLAGAADHFSRDPSAAENSGKAAARVAS